MRAEGVVGQDPKATLPCKPFLAPLLGRTRQQAHACLPLASKRPVSYCLQALDIRVEDNGVEPMTSCMPCKRSSQLS